MGKTAHEDFWPYSPMDNWDCIKEVTGESETVYFAPQGEILSFIWDGERYELHSDALGSCRMITDSDGEIVARYELSAFGEAISVTEDPALADFPMRFVGSKGVRFDGSTGLSLMRQRWYDAQLGRFLNRDPIGLVGGMNLYAYCSNSPVNFVDPDGLHPGYLPVDVMGTTARPPLTPEKIAAYRKKIDASFKLLREFIKCEGMEYAYSRYYDAAKASTIDFDDYVIEANRDAAAHTIVPMMGGPSIIVFNSEYVEDDSLYFTALTLLHEGVHAYNGYVASLDFIRKEWEPNAIANDSLKAALAEFEKKGCRCKNEKR